jgi:hypothetical protein
MLAGNLRACQSTPLCLNDGKVVGMISTHFPVPHSPNQDQLHRVGMLAAYASYLIQHAAPVSSPKTPQDVVEDCCIRFSRTNS